MLRAGYHFGCFDKRVRRWKEIMVVQFQNLPGTMQFRKLTAECTWSEGKPGNARPRIKYDNFLKILALMVIFS